MKLKRKLLLMSAALAVPLLLSGCVNKPLEDLRLSLALTEKYGEIFIVADSFVSGGNWLTAGPLEAVCYPLSDKNLTFKATYSIANHYIYADSYVQTIVRNEIKSDIESVLSQYYDSFIVEVDVFHDYTNFTSKEDISVKSYSETIPEDNSVIINIAILNSEVSHYTDIENALNECSYKFCSINAKIFCNFVSQDIIEKCKELQSDNTFDLDEIFWLLQNEKPFYVYSYYNGNDYKIEYLGENN